MWPGVVGLRNVFLASRKPLFRHRQDRARPGRRLCPAQGLDLERSRALAGSPILNYDPRGGGGLSASAASRFAHSPPSRGVHANWSSSSRPRSVRPSRGHFRNGVTKPASRNSARRVFSALVFCDPSAVRSSRNAQSAFVAHFAADLEFLASAARKKLSSTTDGPARPARRGQACRVWAVCVPSSPYVF